MHNSSPSLRSEKLIPSLRTFNTLLTMMLIFAIATLAGCAGVVSPSQSTPTPSALQIATSSLPAGTEGTNYSATLSATGGAPPYMWSTAGGALPAGLGLSSSTGTIAGIATQSGSFSFKAQVQDAKAASTSAGFSLTVSPGPAPTISAISPVSGPTAGGTSVTISGSNFSSGAGVLFGNVSASTVQVMNTAQIRALTPAESAGVVSIKIQNSDGQSATAANAFTFADSPLQVVTTSLPVGSVGTSYSATLAANGGTPPYTWSTAAGALPTGLQLSANTGTIAGTPTVSGNFSFTTQVHDAKAAASSAGLSLSISPDPAPTISSVSPTSGPATGGTTVTISGGNFRTGAGVRFGSIAAASVQVTNAAQIQAITPAESAGLVGVTVQDSDGQIATAANAFSFAGPPLQIATTLLPAGSVGASYSTTLAANGGTPPYTWSTTAGALPTGLQLSANTGAIAGTPTASGNFSFTAQVRDAKAAASSAGLSLAVSLAPAPTITGISPVSGPTAGGTSVTISGSNFRPGAGVLFGNVSASGFQLTNSSQIQAVTPAESAGVVGVTVQDSDGQSATDANAFTFTVPALQVVTSSLPVGSVGTSYSTALAANGGTPPYTWSTTAGALPTGLLLSANTGTIAGTPTASGNFSFTTQVRDAKAATSSAGLSLSISPNPAPTISSVSPTSGPATGGTTVTISGGNFQTGAGVLFGSIAAASVQVTNATQIQAVTPAESGGAVSVTVQNSDGQTATAANTFTFTGTTSGTSPVVPTPSSDPAAPKIFNASSSAQPGDVIFIQGVNFDSTSQAWLGGATLSAATQLTVVNRVGQTWMAAQVPKSWNGALVLWISNSHGASSAVALNGAVPTHLDALQLVPGGAFRVIGRNLLAPGFNPSVTVDGLPASINLSASDENILVVTAPASLSPTSASVIMVDNGNGTGATQLDRKISVVSGSGDPLALGVGWGAGFKFTGNVIKVNTPCNGTQDDSNAIIAAISSASGSGGVVQLPAGTCRVAKTLTMKSNVVLRGAGKDVTILKYEANYPIFAQGCDLIGIEDLSLVNSGAATQGPLWENNTRSFLQRVKIDMGVSQQLFFTSNVNLVVSQTDFIQRGALGGRGPYLFNTSSGLVFSGNTTTSIDGSPAFQATHDALYINNHFTRDATNQNEMPVVVTHRFVMDFAYRIAIVGNTFDVINGPITNKSRNDGETLLAEGGGSARTENTGTVASATSTTVSDPSNTINVNPFGTGIPGNYGVAIVNGTGAGQTRELVAYSNHTMTVDHPWDVIPDSTSHYATFVWGLEKSILKGNTLIDNPRGIWLYQTAVREVDILANTIINGGGIYLRTFEAQKAKQFDPIYNVRIRDNKVSNSNGLWMSYATVVLANQDATNFGIADIGIEIRNTVLTANVPNVTSSSEDYASQEGFMNLMRIETSGAQLSNTPMLLGTIFQGGQCVNCKFPFIVGTGAYGTTLIGNLPLPSTPNFLSDWHTLGASSSGSIGTVVQ